MSSKHSFQDMLSSAGCPDGLMCPCSWPELVLCLPAWLARVGRCRHRAQIAEGGARHHGSADKQACTHNQATTQPSALSCTHQDELKQVRLVPLHAFRVPLHIQHTKDWHCKAQSSMLTRMSSNRVDWSTLTNSVSHVLMSSSVLAGLSSGPCSASTWNLQYSITLARTAGHGRGVHRLVLGRAKNMASGQTAQVKLEVEDAIGLHELVKAAWLRDRLRARIAEQAGNEISLEQCGWRQELDCSPDHLLSPPQLGRERQACLGLSGAAKCICVPGLQRQSMQRCT